MLFTTTRLAVFALHTGWHLGACRKETIERQLRHGRDGDDEAPLSCVRARTFCNMLELKYIIAQPRDGVHNRARYSRVKGDEIYRVAQLEARTADTRTNSRNYARDAREEQCWEKKDSFAFSGTKYRFKWNSQEVT